jgi:FSR family fosmidomycin resistance protein-like MFS transporter
VRPLTAIALLTHISLWAKGRVRQSRQAAGNDAFSLLPRGLLMRTIGILMLLVFAKDFYMAGLISYLIFYLEYKFALSVQAGQFYLFLFLFAAAAGTLLGGPIGDRIGRKRVICASILGAAPFSLSLPYADLFWTGILVVIVGFIQASAFSTIVVFAQELMPGKVGTVAGLFFGLSFGAGGIGAAVLGRAADTWSIGFVYQFCSFLPLMGILAFLLPDPRKFERARHPNP